MFRSSLPSPLGQLGAACALFALPVSLALAQAYPAKPIRFLIPQIAGSAYDLAGRVITGKMSETLGQPFISENLQIGRAHV